jgi:hypothetical protein
MLTIYRRHKHPASLAAKAGTIGVRGHCRHEKREAASAFVLSTGKY